jgi:hypothetical protein
LLSTVTHLLVCTLLLLPKSGTRLQTHSPTSLIGYYRAKEPTRQLKQSHRHSLPRSLEITFALPRSRPKMFYLPTRPTGYTLFRTRRPMASKPTFGERPSSGSPHRGHSRPQPVTLVSGLVAQPLSEGPGPGTPPCEHPRPQLAMLESRLVARDQLLVAVSPARALWL